MPFPALDAGEGDVPESLLRGVAPKRWHFGASDDPAYRVIRSELQELLLDMLVDTEDRSATREPECSTTIARQLIKLPGLIGCALELLLDRYRDLIRSRSSCCAMSRALTAVTKSALSGRRDRISPIAR